VTHVSLFSPLVHFLTEFLFSPQLFFFFPVFPTCRSLYRRMSLEATLYLMSVRAPFSPQIVRYMKIEDSCPSSPRGPYSVPLNAANESITVRPSIPSPVSRAPFLDRPFLPFWQTLDRFPCPSLGVGAAGSSTMDFMSFCVKYSQIRPIASHRRVDLESLVLTFKLSPTSYSLDAV